jgi:hypothetical protein
MKGITKLDLSGTKVTLAGLKGLKDLTDLKELDARSLHVTDARAAELKKLMPKAFILN